MTLLPLALALAGVAPQAKPQVAWVTLQDGVKGSWSVKAVYPTLVDESPLATFFNAELKRECESRFYAEAYAFRKEGQRNGLSTEVRAILSVSNGAVASGLIAVKRTAKPTDLIPVTCWMSGSQALRCVWGSLVKPGSDAVAFANTLVLPALNAVRAANKMPALAELPSGLLDSFVVTQANVGWIVPPGVAGTDATQIKVPLGQVQAWSNPDGPLRYLTGAPVTPAEGAVPLKGVITWPIRETIPPGAVVQISLLRDRDSGPEGTLGVRSLPVQDPPMEFSIDFSGIKAQPDDRFYLDVRIIALGAVLYRNREAIRVPAQGWQTAHEIKLQKERDEVATASSGTASHNGSRA